MDYEKTLLWLAKVQFFIQEEAKSKEIDKSTINIIQSKLDHAVQAIGSQSPLWPPAYARLSASSIDIAYFEFERVKDSIKLPIICSELVDLVVACFGKCPQKD